VTVISKGGKRIPGYVGLVITGRCDPADYTKSEIVLRRYPRGLFPSFRGRYFVETSWDGSDLFMERADSSGSTTAWIYLTDRVRDALTQAAADNVRLERAGDVEISVSAVEIGSPHLLPSDIQTRVSRAKEAASANDA
jgi:hypothetical protein